MPGAFSRTLTPTTKYLVCSQCTASCKSINQVQNLILFRFYSFSNIYFYDYCDSLNRDRRQRLVGLIALLEKGTLIPLIGLKIQRVQETSLKHTSGRLPFPSYQLGCQDQPEEIVHPKEKSYLTFGSFYGVNIRI